MFEPVNLWQERYLSVKYGQMFFLFYKMKLKFKKMFLFFYKDKGILLFTYK